MDPALCGVHLAVPFPMVQSGTGPGDVPVYRSLVATPRWSIDGRTVVYSRPPADGTSGSEVYLGDVGARGSTAVAEEIRLPLSGPAFAPVFSPVDDRIAVLLQYRTSTCRLNDLALMTRGGRIQPVVAGSMLAACAIGGFDWSQRLPSSSRRRVRSTG